MARFGTFTLLRHLVPRANRVTLRPDFPGRVFKIIAVEKADGATLKTHLGPEARAHVTIRNFPDSVADFRRRTGIREGGEVYLFATTDLRGRSVVLVCEKLTAPVQTAK